MISLGFLSEFTAEGHPPWQGGQPRAVCVRRIPRRHTAAFPGLVPRRGLLPGSSLLSITPCAKPGHQQSRRLRAISSSPLCLPGPGQRLYQGSDSPGDAKALAPASNGASPLHPRLEPRMQQTPQLIKSVKSNGVNCTELLIKAELSNHSKYWSGSLERSPANAGPPAAGPRQVTRSFSLRAHGEEDTLLAEVPPRRRRCGFGHGRLPSPRSAFLPPIKREFSIAAN